MGKFPKTLAGAEVSDIDLDEEDFRFHGKRLTENRAELAAKVFRRADNLIPGGKSLSGEGQHSPIVQTRVPVEVRAKLQALAARRGVRTSKLLREAIDQFLEHEAG
ncbi:ribbon-helix-helix domain-containing protein (plasmid) [Mycobacterium sp. SMC-2]|uniref:ribbon-helix-helix domain-containing protein n=1 Tax=Mycobacterium sp. SMC-2 TaxID=2857058 RepID=UPI0021B46ABC|nr:ribbon-helix-helix domain-containing protein [Mycobacterium sp. SMC-2]UXA06570.1 ribbon-helix-helix domain-containing protein [Mycobacterium sp. SMC-2]UXA09662.1 ribbon-helix-helix domain-containing protein [Mycobacterium sp. SMC-2]